MDLNKQIYIVLHKGNYWLIIKIFCIYMEICNFLSPYALPPLSLITTCEWNSVLILKMSN